METKNSQDVEDYKEKVKKARDVVEELGLGEPYKTNAFNTILKDLLDNKKHAHTMANNKSDSSPLNENISSSINFEEVPYFDDFDKLNWKNKLLNLLQWAKHHHSEKGLLTSDFVDIFKERFGMPYIDSGKIGKELVRRLLKTPLITRKKINQRDFRWFITPKGEEYLKKRLNEHKNLHNFIRQAIC